MPSVFLYAPQDFHNVCVLARTLEVFGVTECFVFDPNRLIRDRYGKARSRELRVVSAGAFEKIQWTRVEEPGQFFTAHGSRVIATVADPKAQALTSHRFSTTDVLLFGSESHGLPPEIVAASAAAVTIPAQGRTRSLNLAVAIGIVLFEWQRQISATTQG
jgi:tRNA G18 (ribose-2'-O)-methylase SpoU